LIVVFIIMNIITNIFLSIVAVIIIFILGIKLSFKKSSFNFNKCLEQAVDKFSNNYFKKFSEKK